MSAAQATAKKAQPTEPKPWSMPKTNLGDPVLINHRSSPREKLIGFVVETGQRSIAVLAAGNYYPDVWHKDDPRLEANPQLRTEIDGTWEPTEFQIKLEQRLSALEEKVFKT